MMRKLLSTTAIVLFSGAMAFAQSDTGATGTMSGSIESWDQTTRDAFFSDNTTLRSDSEIQSGWQSLDSAQQAKIRADCESMQADAGQPGATEDTADTGTTSDTSSDVTGSITSDSSTTTPTTDTEATAGADASADMAQPDMASIEKLCAQIQSF